MNNTNIITNNKLSFSKFGSILAVISSAVGLGNIWKFPTLVGENGGALFIIIYILSSLFASIPVLLAEFYIGYKTKKGSIEAVQEISNNKKIWQILSISSFVTCILIIGFYSDVIGWVLKYFTGAITNTLNITNTMEAEKLFADTISSPFMVLFFQFIVLGFIGCILYFGATKGIEKTIKFSLPVLFGILVIMSIKSLTLEGSGEALKFLFTPDFSKLNSSVFISALGLAFFKLSAGMLVMANYFSYFPQGIKPSTLLFKLLFADLCVSILCGIVIFPIIFTYGFEVTAGPGLLFISVPVLFQKITFGSILLAMFFFLSFLAGIGALISIEDYSNRFLEKIFKISRKKSVICGTILSMLAGSLAALSTTDVLGNFKIFNKNIFDMFDYISSNIVMPLTGLLIIAFILICVGKKDFQQYLIEQCKSNKIIIKTLTIIMAYITPFVILFIWINSLGLFK